MISTFEMETKGTAISITIINIQKNLFDDKKRNEKGINISCWLFDSGNLLIFVCRKLFVTFEMVHKFCLLQFRNYTLGRPSEIT